MLDSTSKQSRERLNLTGGAGLNPLPSYFQTLCSGPGEHLTPTPCLRRCSLAFPSRGRMPVVATMSVCGSAGLTDFPNIRSPCWPGPAGATYGSRWQCAEQRRSTSRFGQAAGCPPGVVTAGSGPFRATSQGRHLSASNRCFVVETMGNEPTTPCLQSNDRPTRLPGRMCAGQANRVGRTCGCVPVFTVVDRCYWNADGTNPNPVARKSSFV